MSSSSSKQRRKQRQKLWNENPHCYYCGILTVPPEIRTKEQVEKGYYFDNMATLEHLFSRLNPKRYEKHKFKTVRHVLACYKCNNDKSMEDTNINFAEEHRRRSLKLVDNSAF